MAGWADIQSRGRTWLVSGVLIALGVVVGYELPQSSVSPKSEVGTVRPPTGKGDAHRPGTEFGFKPTSGSAQNYWFVDYTPWQATPNGKWKTSGIPTCLKPAEAAAKSSKPASPRSTSSKSGKSGRSAKSGKSSTSAPAPTPSPSAAQVTLGVVTIHKVGPAPGGPTVVWLECYG